jgi:ribosomal RNA small subunit methyltransferase A
LGQNFLSDQNYVLKIVDSFADNSENGHRVIEIGPGPGALTRVLQPRYPNMTAIEIDQRAVAFLGTKLPNLNIVHQDVLTADWPGLAAERGGRLNIIANLPYYIVSQVLFTLADSHKAINKAVVTMQWEVAERVCAKPRTKAYGIPSVVFQLYAKPQLNFKIPPSVFFPKPKVDSALVTLDFSKPNPALYRVRAENLRAVLLNSFRQRRKMMRQSLKELLQQEGLTLPEKWGTMRPEELKPAEFVELTIDLFGEISEEEAQLCGHYPARDTVAGIGGEVMPPTREELAATKVWRQMKELQ